MWNACRWNAASVIDDRDAAVDMDRDFDRFPEAGHMFVDAVVHDFVDEMVQPVHARAADVHRGSLADGIEAFEYFDLIRAVTVGFRLDRIVLLVVLGHSALTEFCTGPAAAGSHDASPQPAPWVRPGPARIGASRTGMSSIPAKACGLSNLDRHHDAFETRTLCLLNQAGAQCGIHLQRNRLSIHDAQGVQEVAGLKPVWSAFTLVTRRQFLRRLP